MSLRISFTDRAKVAIETLPSSVYSRELCKSSEEVAMPADKISDDAAASGSTKNSARAACLVIRLSILSMAALEAKLAPQREQMPQPPDAWFSDGLFPTFLLLVFVFVIERTSSDLEHLRDALAGCCHAKRVDALLVGYGP